MANKGNNWNSFMEDKPTRILLNVLCMGFCGYHAFGAVMALVRPGESSQILMAQMGQTGYVAMTVVRLLVMLWAVVAFARMAIKTYQEDDKE